MHHHQQALGNCAGANNLDTNLRFVYSVHILFVHVTQVGTWWEYARCNMYTQYIGIVDWWQKICKKKLTCMVVWFLHDGQPDLEYPYQSLCFYCRGRETFQ